MPGYLSHSSYDAKTMLVFRHESALISPFHLMRKEKNYIKKKYICAFYLFIFWCLRKSMSTVEMNKKEATRMRSNAFCHNVCIYLFFFRGEILIEYWGVVIASEYQSSLH